MKISFKKMLICVFCVVMMLAIAPIMSEFDADVSDSFNIQASAATTYSGKCTDTISWSYVNGTLYLTGTGKMPYYTWLNQPWNSIRTLITTVIIGEGITEIHEYTFWDCSNLTNVTIADSVTLIGYMTFAYCVNLKSLTLGDSVEKILECAFYSCTSLESITIPSTVVSIGSSSFDKCSSLSTIYFAGTQTQWNNIEVTGLYNSTYLDGVTIKYGTSITADSGSTWIELDWDKVSGATGYQIYNNGTKIATITNGATSYTVTGLTGATDYDFVIRSFTSYYYTTVYGSYSSTFTFTTNPYKASFSSYSSTEESVTVKWNKVSGADGYRIYQYINGSWVSLATVSSSTLTYTIGGLNEDTTYKFKVKAYTRDVDAVAQFGVASDTFVTKTNSTQVQMTSFSATTTAIRINWQKVYSADGYRIYQYINGSWVTIATVSSSTLTYRIDGLTSDTVYKFKVKAYYVSGSTTKWYDASETFVTNTDYTQVQMTTFSATTSAIRINWSEIESADGYRVYQYINGSWVSLATVSSSTLTYRIDGLNSDTIYKFKVKAYYRNSKGTAIWYDASETFTANTDYTQVQMTSYSATSTAIRINWDEIESADGYRVYQYINGSWVSLATVSSSTLTYRISGLTADTSYKFKVKAYYRNSSGTAIWYDASETFVAVTD